MKSNTDPSVDVFKNAKDLNFFTYDKSNTISLNDKAQLVDHNDYTGSLSSAKAFANFLEQDFLLSKK